MPTITTLYPSVSGGGTSLPATSSAAISAAAAAASAAEAELAAEVAIAAGVGTKPPCVVATTGNITLSGTQTIDGIAVTNGQRVLVRAQTNAAENGIYVVSTGAWLRATDFNSENDAVSGTSVFVTRGDEFAETLFHIETDDPLEIGTDEINFNVWLNEAGGGLSTYSVIGNGITNDSAALDNADAAYSATGRALILRAGRTYLVGTSITLSSPLIVEPGALLDVANGVTLTLNGPVFDYGPYQIFDTNTSGVVAGSFGGQPIRPFWWGVATNGTTQTTANDALFDAAVTAALNASVPLECSDIEIVRHTAKTYTASGFYDWRNIYISKPDATGSATTFLFSGTQMSTAVPLTGNVAVGAKSTTVATGLSITAGNRYLLFDTRWYNTDASGSRASKSEYVTIESYDSGTGALVFEMPVQSSYLTANNAGIMKINTRNMRIRMTGKLVGGGTSLEQTGMFFRYCHIEGGDLHVEDMEEEAVGFDQCSHGDVFHVTAIRSNKAGFGYGVGVNGCDHPIIGDVVAHNCRHPISGGKATGSTAILMSGSISAITKAASAQVTFVGHGLQTGNTVIFSNVGGMTQINSAVAVVTVIDADNFTVPINSTGYSTYTSGGTLRCYITPRCIGGSVQSVLGIDTISSLFDSHAAWDKVVVGNVQGNMATGTSQAAVTVQSNDVSIGHVNVEGFDGNGVVVQYYGKPADENPCTVSFASINLHSSGDGTDYALSVVNQNGTEHTPVYVHVGALTGRVPSGINCNAQTDAGPTMVTVGSLAIDCTAGHGLIAYSQSTYGRAVISVQSGALNATSSSTSHYALYATGATYYASATAAGGIITFADGEVTRTLTSSYLARVIGGDITLGPNVRSAFTTNFKQTTDGDVYRTSRAAATS